MPSQASIRSHPAVPLRGGLAGQVLGAGELTPVPGHDALGVAQRGGGDCLAAAAERGMRLGHGVRCRSFVTGDGGHACQVSQVGGNEHDAPDPVPAVSGPAERADGGRGVAPGGGNTGLAYRAEEFHEPDRSASSRGPAQPEFRFGRFELAQGGEQPRPPVAHDRLGEAVRMRRGQVRGLVEGGQGGGLDACPGDRADRGDHQRQGEPFPASRHPGKPGRAPAVPVLLGQVARQPGRVGQQDLGPRRKRRISLAGYGSARFDFSHDLLGVAGVPGQAGQQVAAPYFQLRFAGLPGAGDAAGRQRRGARTVAKLVRRPCGAEQHPGLDAGSRRGQKAGRCGQELAHVAVPAGGDPPPGQPGGQFPSRLRLGAAECPGQRRADVGLVGGQLVGPARPFGARQGRLRRPGYLQCPLQQPGVHRASLAGGGQPASGELADGLQQRITDQRSTCPISTSSTTRCSPKGSPPPRK